jgi:hypothetical protein
VFLGNADGTFQAAVQTTVSAPSGWGAAGDFNGDGKVDLAITMPGDCVRGYCPPGGVGVLIGNGDGSFQRPVEYAEGLPTDVAVGDFNGDGKPDLAVVNNDTSVVSILLNNGDGTFQSQVNYATEPFSQTIVAADFNGDGKLDLLVGAGLGGPGSSLLLGNGDGTFQNYLVIPAPGPDSGPFAVGDFNGDGKLDLATDDVLGGGGVFILLGNGDGTFQAPVEYPGSGGSLAVGDLNGDGQLDLIMGCSAVLLGTGNGSFQAPLGVLFAGYCSGPVAVADFNHDGSPDIAAPGGPYGVSVLLSTPFKAISPSSLNFGSQGVGTTSAAQTITISNPSNVSFNIASIVASGNFSQTNNCGASLALGAHCEVTVSFTPASTGSETGAITVTDSTKISPLAIPLSGNGVSGPFLTLNPSRANFEPDSVGASGAPAFITLVNTGNASVSITGISIAGADPSDFTQTNNCGNSLPAAASCTVNVTFTPTRAGLVRPASR